MATYGKAIKVTVDGPREPRSKTSEYQIGNYIILYYALMFTFIRTIDNIVGVLIKENYYELLKFLIIY